MSRPHINHLHAAHYRTATIRIKRAALTAWIIYYHNDYPISNRIENIRFSLI